MTTPAERHQKKWPDVLLMMVLALLPFLFFWRLLAPQPADRMHIAAGDFTEQYFPLRAFAARQWVQGQPPLWNPYLYGGQPALADIQSGALYPPHVLEALLLGWGGPLWGAEVGFPLWALELQVIFHFSLAAVGMYLFVRHVGRQNGFSRRRARWGGIVSSLAFTYGGYLTGFPVQQMTILAVSAWLPWVMWAVSAINRQAGYLLVQKSSPWTRLLPPVGWGALAWALALLAGHPQTALYIFYLTLMFSLYRAVSGWYDAGPLERLTPRQGIKLLRFLGVHISGWLAVILLGSLIAAAQLLPTLEFIRHSLRADLSYQAVSAGLPLNELISILYPGYFGGSPEYVGIVTLVLIGLTLALGQPRREIFFWAGAGLASLLLAFGGNTFLYPLFYLLAPGFEAVRQQERAFLVYSFSAAVLAGYGVIVLAGPLSRAVRGKLARFERGARVVIVLFFGLLALYLYGSVAVTARGDEVNLFVGVLRHHLFALLFFGGTALLLALRRRGRLRLWGVMSLLAVWLAFNLFTVNWQFNLEQRETEPFEGSDTVHFLQTQLSSAAHMLAQVRVSSGGLLPGGNSAASVYQLQDLTGNTPLQLARVEAFYHHMPAWRMWQLMNARYVVAERDIAGAGLSPVFIENDLQVFEVGDPFPRAWFVAETETVPDDDAAIARLADDTFDLRRSAVVARPLPQTLSRAENSTVTLSRLTPTSVRAEVEASGTHLLIFSQIFYPGWQAFVDGQPADLHRVNVVQQGVVVPPGRYMVEIVFAPRSLWWGIILSGAGFLLTVLCLGMRQKYSQWA